MADNFLTKSIGAVASGFGIPRMIASRARALDLGTEGNFTPPISAEYEIETSDGIHLHVEVDEPKGPGEGLGSASTWGDAPTPTVVMAHGYLFSSQGWVLQRRALVAAGYRVVCWDQRGHGKSQAGPTWSYTINRLGSDMHEVINQIVPTGPVVVVGHSMGGMTIMALMDQHAEFFRERVVGVALVATSAGQMMDVDFGLGQRMKGMAHKVAPDLLKQIAERPELLTRARRTGREVELFFVDRYSFGGPVAMALVEFAADIILGTDMNVAQALIPELLQHDKVLALPELHGIETTVLIGDRDVVTPPEHSQMIVQYVPSAEHIVVPKAGHLIILERPKVVNAAILDLMDRAQQAVAVA